MTFREAARKLMNNTPELNFDVERNDKIIGKMQGLPVKDKDYLHFSSSISGIEDGDVLINGLNERFLVIRIEKIDKNIFRLYFTRLLDQEQP